MDLKHYHARLQELAQTLREHAERVQIKGDGAGSFVVASRGRRSVELYAGKHQEWYIDPALDEQLQGEEDFPDAGQALAAALKWLNEG